MDRERHDLDVVQDAVDAEAHHSLHAARLQVDVGCALLEGVGQEMIHRGDHVLVRVRQLRV